eukprot:5597541-Pleurochrysis_carterae.AAC.1
MVRVSDPLGRRQLKSTRVLSETRHFLLSRRAHRTAPSITSACTTSPQQCFIDVQRKPTAKWASTRILLRTRATTVQSNNGS